MERQDQVKTIGLIGGLSWESTAEYYRLINQEVNRRLGGFHSARIVIYSVDFEEEYRLHHAGAWDQTARNMAEAARRLQSAGADIILIGTNTVHKVADEVAAAVDSPLIHIADVTAAAIKKRGLNSVALLGTRFTMAEDFYRGRLHDRHGLKVYVPEGPDAEIVNDAIYSELVKGIIRDKTRLDCLQVIQGLKAKGAEGVVLGCTELPLLIKQQDLDIPVFDTTFLHAMAAVDAALED
jgi:aspartate racemase